MPAYPVTMLFVFAMTLFTSATLLMMVQPMIGKMITPLLGGTPAVWNTCMVFFQALLLAGYSYAHFSTKYLGVRKQSLLQAGLLMTPFAMFIRLSSKEGNPLAVEKGLITGGLENPIPMLLVLLITSVGVPFFVLSTSAPLLQKWFSSTTHPAAKDPYFLYAASNTGSMLALISYPTIVEPYLRLRDQTWFFVAGYGLLVLLIGFCAAFLWLSPAAKEETKPEPAQVLSGEVTWLRRLRWVVLAAVPSSLMLGATTYMTTDIAAIPLLWVLPLALYLLSFILVFSKVPAFVHKAFVLLLPMTTLLLTFMMLSQNLKPPIFYLIGIHLATLFVVSMVCHGELARNRPSTKYLTEFFLWMSFGGVVGGMFNGLLAPVIFNGIVEYQLAMVIACLLLPPLGLTAESRGNLLGDLALTALCLTVGSALIAVRLWEHNIAFAQIKQGPYLWLSGSLALLLVVGVLAALRFKDARADSVLSGAIVPLILILSVLALNVLGLWGFYRWLPAESRLEGWREYLLPAICFLACAALNSVAVYFLYQTRTSDRRLQAWLDVLMPFAVLLVAVGLLWSLVRGTVLYPHLIQLSDYLNQETTTIASCLMFGLPALLAYSFFERSVRFGLSVAAFLLAGFFTSLFDSSTLYQERSFFGVMRVESDSLSRMLVHGTTLHGRQYDSLPEAINKLYPELRDRETWPLTYFHRTGPIGCVCEAYNTPQGNLGIIGLGTGTMACYAQKGQRVTFYDIDPVVRKISYDSTEYFTFIDQARKRGAQVNLIMGDARLTMERQQLQDRDKYHILVIDAFSSDAIPIHLITYEALLMYLERLSDDGLLCFHISNRYLNLKPVLGNLANKYQKEKRGSLVGFYMNDGEDEHVVFGKTGSTWVVLARNREQLKRLKLGDHWDKSLGLTNSIDTEPVAQWDALKPVLQAVGVQAYKLEPRWFPLPVDPQVGEWTDDYAPIFRVFSW